MFKKKWQKFPEAMRAQNSLGSRCAFFFVGRSNCAYLFEQVEHVNTLKRKIVLNFLTGKITEIGRLPPIRIPSSFDFSGAWGLAIGLSKFEKTVNFAATPLPLG